MTELELFEQNISNISKIIVNLKKKDSDQRTQWKKKCLEYASGLNLFTYEFMRKTIIVIDKYLEKDEEIQNDKDE